MFKLKDYKNEISPYTKYGDIFMYKRLLMMTFIGLFTILLAVVVNAESTTYSNYKVVVDAGHGGYDGGAKGKHSVEKDINLQVALYLKQYLTNLGVEVIMVREKDESFDQTRGNKKRSDLSYRVDLVNRSNADLFVSIHMNAMQDSRWRGAQTFYHPGNEKNKRLAEIIQMNLINHLKNTKREAKPLRSIYILKHIQIPGTLVEAGFLSNPEEEKLLLDPKYQEKVAYAIFLGIIEYLNGVGIE